MRDSRPYNGRAITRVCRVRRGVQLWSLGRLTQRNSRDRDRQRFPFDLPLPINWILKRLSQRSRCLCHEKLILIIRNLFFQLASASKFFHKSQWQSQETNLATIFCTFVIFKSRLWSRSKLKGSKKKCTKLTVIKSGRRLNFLPEIFVQMYKNRWDFLKRVFYIFRLHYWGKSIVWVS